mmetsp:Transcript_14637/g.46561  ORF Transcript_14637/g.46561 Transcript_14637/m.46561 type:complete len:237 (+) Transcript_14637:978-1688(+)
MSASTISRNVGPRAATAAITKLLTPFLTDMTGYALIAAFIPEVVVGIFSSSARLARVASARALSPSPSWKCFSTAARNLAWPSVQGEARRCWSAASVRSWTMRSGDGVIAARITPSSSSLGSIFSSASTVLMDRSKWRTFSANDAVAMQSEMSRRAKRSRMSQGRPSTGLPCMYCSTTEVLMLSLLTRYCRTHLLEGELSMARTPALNAPMPPKALEPRAHASRSAAEAFQTGGRL